MDLTLIFKPNMAGAMPVPITFKKTDLVAAVKGVLCVRLNNIAPSAFSLVYNGAELADSASLASCGLQDGSRVNIVLVRCTRELATPNKSEIKSEIKSVVVRARTLDPKMCTKEKMRSKAKELLKRGVAGLVVMPGAKAGEKRIVMLDKKMLEVVKMVSETRVRNGHVGLHMGSDAEFVFAMKSALGEDLDELEENLEAVQVPPLSSAVSDLVQRMHRTSMLRKEAMQRALRKEAI